MIIIKNPEPFISEVGYIHIQKKITYIEVYGTFHFKDLC